MAYDLEKARLYGLLEERTGRALIRNVQLESEADERALEARNQVGLNATGTPADDIKHDLSMWEELPVGISHYGEDAAWFYQWIDPVGHCADAWMASVPHFNNLMDPDFSNWGLGIHTELPNGVTEELERRWYFILLLTDDPDEPVIQRFSDVPPTHASFDEIQWLADNGIATGFEDGTFKPNEPITRAHMANFLKRYHDNLGG